jgi:hypothetical protein
VVFLNLSGGDCVEDIERLERDGGFSAVLRAIPGFSVKKLKFPVGLEESRR